MNTNWKIDTHGDPLGALQNFVQTLWKQTDLDALVVAPNGGGYVLESPDDLEHMNPFRPVMKTSCSTPAASASSAAYWMRGLSTIGSISFGLALVAGRNRVPSPATGNTALRMLATTVPRLGSDPNERGHSKHVRGQPAAYARMSRSISLSASSGSGAAVIGLPMTR